MTVPENELDLTGVKSGKLTVLHIDEKTYEISKLIYWECQCECGNTCLATPYSITTTLKKSCGCSPEGESGQSPCIIPSGTKFGRLTTTGKYIVNKNKQKNCHSERSVA